MSKNAGATDRLIVPISRADKRAVARKASVGGMSMAEFVRRAVLRYDPSGDLEGEEKELRLLLDFFKHVHGETLAQLDHTDAALDSAPARLDAGKTTAA